MEFDATLTEKDMIRFNLYHTYSKFFAWFTVALAVVALVVAGTTFGKVSGTLTALYILVALVVLIYMPLNTVLSAKRRVKFQPQLLEALHYSIGEDGIRVSRGEETAELPWDSVFRIVGVKTAIYVYSSRIYAYVIPREAVSDRIEEFKALALAHLESRRVKL